MISLFVQNKNMIKDILKKTYLLVIPVLIIGFPLFSVQSGAITGTGGSISNPLDSTSFTALISDIAKWVFLLAIPLATLMFLIGGFMFMISGGNEQKITQAKKTMIWAAVGLAVCLVGAGFTYIIRQLLGVTS